MPAKATTRCFLIGSYISLDLVQAKVHELHLQGKVTVVGFGPDIRLVALEGSDEVTAWSRLEGWLSCRSLDGSASTTTKTVWPEFVPVIENLLLDPKLSSVRIDDHGSDIVISGMRSQVCEALLTAYELLHRENRLEQHSRHVAHF